MWLERIGTVNQNIFFGFCAVVFVIVVLVIAYVIVRLCGRHNMIILPGYSLTSTFVLSTLLICVSVLFRGIQPKWGTHDAMANVCQLFVPFISLGYTLYGSSLLIKMWMIVRFFRFDKNTVEWVGHFVLWVLIVLVGATVIIWEATFTPNVFVVDTTPNSTNSTTTSMQNGDNSSVVVGAFYECRGWSEDGSRDNEQFGWRVAMSCLMAILLLLATSALPLYGCLHIHSDRVRPAAKATVFSTLVVSVNTTCCVIAGLIAWFQYWPTKYPSFDRRLDDSNKYAIIGSLQLWMLLIAVAATLIAEIITMRTERSLGGGKHPMRNQSNSKTTSFSTTEQTRSNKHSGNGKAKQSTVAEDAAVGVVPDTLTTRSNSVVTDRKQDDDNGDRSSPSSSVVKMDRGSVGSKSRLNVNVEQEPTMSTFVSPSSGHVTTKSDRSSAATLDEKEFSDNGTFSEVSDDDRATEHRISTEVRSSDARQRSSVGGNDKDDVGYVDFQF